MSNKDIRVVALLTAELYVVLDAMATEDDVSDSAFIRRLIREEAQHRAALKASAKREQKKLEEDAQLFRTVN